MIHFTQLALLISICSGYTKAEIINDGWQPDLQSIGISLRSFEGGRNSLNDLGLSWSLGFQVSLYYQGSSLPLVDMFWQLLLATHILILRSFKFSSIFNN